MDYSAHTDCFERFGLLERILCVVRVSCACVLCVCVVRVCCACVLYVKVCESVRVNVCESVCVTVCERV